MILIIRYDYKMDKEIDIINDSKLELELELELELYSISLN